MPKDVLHIRISEEVKRDLEGLVKAGLFSNLNEAIRQAIRNQLLKYHEERRK